MIDLQSSIDTLKGEVKTLEVENKQLMGQIQELALENMQYEETVKLSADSINLIDKVSLLKRNTIKTKVERVITEGLKSVYGADYSVEFEYQTKNNRTSAEMLLNKNGIKRNMDGFGGGVADVIAFSLKLLVMLSIGTCDRILVSDEPGKHMDMERVQKFFQFVQFVSKRMNTQIIMCSHHQCSRDYADRLYRLQLKGDVTVSELC